MVGRRLHVYLIPMSRSGLSSPGEVLYFKQLGL